MAFRFYKPEGDEGFFIYKDEEASEFFYIFGHNQYTDGAIISMPNSLNSKCSIETKFVSIKILEAVRNRTKSTYLSDKLLIEIAFMEKNSEEKEKEVIEDVPIVRNNILFYKTKMIRLDRIEYFDYSNSGVYMQFYSGKEVNLSYDKLLKEALFKYFEDVPSNKVF